jgi:phage-related minor tail protein
MKEYREAIADDKKRLEQFYNQVASGVLDKAENIEKKIEAQLEKLKQLKAQKQAIDAREKTKQKEQERKDDTRRKILLGSYLIKKMQSNEANKEKILAELNEYLTENRDRQLFDLPDIEA